MLQASDIRTMDGTVFDIGLEEMKDDMLHYCKQKKDTENAHEGYRTMSWIRMTEGTLRDGSNKQLHSGKSSSCEEMIL